MCQDQDPRPRYDVLQPVTALDGGFRWLRVGSGYENPDGTIDAYLDAIVIGNRFRLEGKSPGQNAPRGSDGPLEEPEGKTPVSNAPASESASMPLLRSRSTSASASHVRSDGAP